MNRVKGKVAIITGASSGLGKADALLLAGEGAKVVVADTNEIDGKAVAEQISREGGEAIFLEHDVSTETSWRDLIKNTLAKFGRLDVLVNSAGVFFGKSIEETSLKEWKWLMSVNLDGVFLGIKYAIGAMKDNGGGSIINMSSAGGIVGTVDAAAYDASKGGVRLLTKAAALECSKAGHNYNIRVNSIHPGVMKTPMNEAMRKDETISEIMLQWHPIGHFGEADDIAYGVLYLASDESKFVTGAELVIDGGWTAR